MNLIKQFTNFFKKSADSIYGLYKSTTGYSSSKWTKGEALSLYQKSLYANKAIQKRAEKVGQIKFTLKNKKGDIVENEWTTLLDRPNKTMTGDQFWRTAQKYYDIYGFVVLQKDFGDKVFKSNKVPDSLEILLPINTTIYFNETKTDIVKYEYTQEGGKIVTYLPNEVIYLYNPNPSDPLTGESLLSSAVRAIETEVEIGEYHTNVLKNGGKLETIFKVKNPMTSKQLDELREQYHSKYSSAKASGEPLFLGGDIDVENTALSPQELSYLETKVSTIEDLVIATGVPRALLGVTGGETYANSDASIRIFLRETIKPLMDNLVNVLDWRLIPEDFDLDYIDPTPEDVEKKVLLLKTGHEVSALTTNEKREMLGFDPIKGADDILVPMNLIAMDSSGNNGDTETKKKAIAHPLQNKVVREAYAKLSDKRLAKKEKQFSKAVKSFFSGQEKRLLSKLDDISKAKKKNIIDDAFNENIEVSIAKETLLPILRQIFQEAGNDTMQTFELGKFHFTDSMETSLQKRAEMFSKSIIATTNEQLQRVFRDSFDNQESRADLVERIKNLYNDISDGRANVIASTEVHNAVQDANLFAYKQGGLTIKIWVTVGDANVREEHQVLDGEEKLIDMPFSNGLMYPSEPNCRCTI